MHSLVGIGGGDGLSKTAPPVTDADEALLLDDTEHGVIKGTRDPDPVEVLSLSVAAEAVTAVPEDEASAILRAVVTLDGWRCELCGTQRSFFAGSVEEKEEALALVRNKEEGRDLAPYIPHLR